MEPKIGLTIISILCIFCGTYLITRRLFVESIKTEIQRRDLKFEKIKGFFKIVCFIYRINAKNWTMLFTLASSSDEEAKKIKHHYEPFKGFIWITIGCLLQIIVLLLF